MGIIIIISTSGNKKFTGLFTKAYQELHWPILAYPWGLALGTSTFYSL